MMRVASGSGAVLRGMMVAGAAAALVGCAPKPAALDESTSGHGAVVGKEEVTNVGVAQAAPADAGVLLIRELKIIDDNGQQGVFAKLSRPPREVSHVLLSNPNQLLIELTGPMGENIVAERYSVDNPLVEQVQVGGDEGKMRLTLFLKGDTAPTYTVDDLDDTIVAFLGEPRGTTDPVHESIVFTQRAVPGAAPAPAPVAIPAKRSPARGGAPASDVVAVVPPSPASDTHREGADVRAKKLYHGAPISLDLKDADVHNVIRLLADVSGLNIVATDDVKGTITLRLNDIPWDQALDIVLQTQNLESVHDGNVLRISTVKRLREEREELRKAQLAAAVVEPLQVAYLQVNYAKAKKLAELVSGAQRIGQPEQGRGTAGAAGAEEYGVLTPRGSVMVDEFTNTLIVRDIDSGIRNTRDLVRRLDVQIPQVLIESNIVEATTDFARELGVQWGYQANIGPQTGTSTGANFPGTIGFGGSGLGSGAGVPFLVDFPSPNVEAGAGSALDLALGSLNGAQSLDLRLTALEQKGQGRIISRPRVVTLNNVAATIQSLTILRVRLPSTGTVVNTGAGGSAGTATSATEKIETGITLEVTPQVSSDGFVLLDMFAKSSQADFTHTVDNIPTEITRQATSHVLVRDGQTVVLGGIYRDTAAENVNGVPWFNQLPGLSWFFKMETIAKRREDLLVFLTPRVLKGSGAATAANLAPASQLWENRGNGPNS